MVSFDQAVAVKVLQVLACDQVLLVRSHKYVAAYFCHLQNNQFEMGEAHTVLELTKHKTRSILQVKEL